MSSLLEDPPMPTRSRGWGHYLLPALVLLNVLLMLSLLGVLPPVFGDQPDPGRLNRQIDAERVRVVPGGAAAAEAAASTGAAGQNADRQADAAPQGGASGNRNAAASDERQAASAGTSDRNASDRQATSSRTGAADRQNTTSSGLSRNIAPGVSSARPRPETSRRQEQQGGNRTN